MQKNLISVITSQREVQNNNNLEGDFLILDLPD